MSPVYSSNIHVMYGASFPVGAMIILFVLFIGAGLLLVILYICLRRLGYTVHVLLCKRCYSKNDEARVGCGRVGTLKSMTTTTTLDQIATPILRVSLVPGDAHYNAALECDADMDDIDTDCENTKMAPDAQEHGSLHEPILVQTLTLTASTVTDDHTCSA